MKSSLSVAQYRAEILTIFRSYFGRNDDFIISFWNLLTFNIKGPMCFWEASILPTQPVLIESMLRAIYGSISQQNYISHFALIYPVP